MIVQQLPLADPSATRQPRFSELLQLDRRLAYLTLSDDLPDGELIARALDYVADLVREIDLVRPPGKPKPLPWESGSDGMKRRGSCYE
jgi:hypothetical protein